MGSTLFRSFSCRSQRKCTQVRACYRQLSQILGCVHHLHPQLHPHHRLQTILRQKQDHAAVVPIRYGAHAFSPRSLARLRCGGAGRKVHRLFSKCRTPTISHATQASMHSKSTFYPSPASPTVSAHRREIAYAGIGVYRISYSGCKLLPQLI